MCLVKSKKMTIFEIKIRILRFLRDNLWLIHNGDFEQRIFSTSKLALASSPFAYLIGFVTDWFSLNSGYVIFVFIAIIIDHLVGSWVHAFIKRDFSMKRNIFGFFTKTFLAIAVGVLAEGIGYIMGVGFFVTDYFNTLSRLMVFIYPAGSALMNVSIITKGAFPPTAWMERIKNFSKDMDLKHLKEDKKDVQD